MVILLPLLVSRQLAAPGCARCGKLLDELCLLALALEAARAAVFVLCFLLVSYAASVRGFARVREPGPVGLVQFPTLSKDASSHQLCVEGRPRHAHLAATHKHRRESTSAAHGFGKLSPGPTEPRPALAPAAVAYQR